MRNRLLIAVLALNAGSLVASIVGWDGSDSFQGTQLNSCNWELETYGGSVSQNNSLFLTTVNQPTSTAGIHTQYTVTGDFDLSVDYEILDGFDQPLVPAGDFPHTSATLRIQSEADRAIFFSRDRNPGGNGYSSYTRLSGHTFNGPFQPSDARSGSLRMTRNGSTTTLLERERGPDWKTVAQIDGLSEPVYVYVGAGNINAANAIRVRFSNFQILTGTISSRSFTRSTAYRSRESFHSGGVVCDYLAHLFWGGEWQSVHPLDVMKQNGFDTVRVGVLTSSSPLLRGTPVSQWTSLGWHDEFWSSREFAMEILHEAAQRGLHLNVFFFMSDQAAYGGRQKAPREWQGLSVEATAAAIEDYTFRTVTDFQQNGLHVEIYDIGNEIEYGIAGFALGERIPNSGIDVVRDLTWMRANVWDTEARLLQAAIRGIRRADPNAKTVLHIANLNVGNGSAFTRGFFQTMIDDGVDFDYAGFSHPYPAPNWTLDQYTTDCWFQRLQELFDSMAAMKKPVIISEAAYPNASDGISGPPMREFPFTPDGQAAWLREMLRFLSGQTNVIGFNYFYPDYSHRDVLSPLELQSSGLFVTDTTAEPAMLELRIRLAQLAASATTTGRTVQFHSNMTGPFVASSYLWDFGDRFQSTEASPQHVYTLPGTYSWSVTAQTTAGNVNTSGSVTITGSRRRAVGR